MQVKLRIFLASAQCLGYHLEKIIKLTNDMCYPSEDTILEQTEKMINSISPAALFVAVNGNHLIDKFQKLEHVSIFEHELSQLIQQLKQFSFLDIYGQIDRQKIKPYRSMIQKRFPNSRLNIQTTSFCL
ncbi:unnamed protein product [Rotaria magnacalcarata]|uniref:Uncharacterized protein n=1 Tax=Rotaria magnacalcarata TaxID=392030 RepID=A0A8S2K3F6_9BILA|nr:unnamed protein product [Rotaria magnacalcarata]